MVIAHGAANSSSHSQEAKEEEKGSRTPNLLQGDNSLLSLSVLYPMGKNKKMAIFWENHGSR
jgi:hypothetical protein